MAVVLYNKNYTETLFEMLERFRNEYPEYSQSKITYAGRLDPMAEGLMILLTDEDVRKKDSYLGLDKIYHVEFMLGVSTDTYDVLGRIQSRNNPELITKSQVVDSIISLVNMTEHVYPMYSSKTVEGKPLWQYARKSEMPSYIPRKEIQIYDAEYQGSSCDKNGIQEIIINVQSVNGDFRQDDIVKDWKQLLNQDQVIKKYKMKIHASSGTYMRSLVQHIGEQLGVGATTMRIIRTHIGADTLT